ncbi:hypothetical protein [Flexivirga alba]|uniref:DUF2746 domain-containing protein n=1 Tax=Flexivirga alba TaxID=702742 RepID=A0ABW2AJ95_9MICO
MSWWQWVLLWILLAVLGTAYLGWRVWRLWAPLKRLGSELAIAQEQLAAIEAKIDTLDEQLRSVDDLAVLQDPAQLRRHRSDLKAQQRAQREARRKSRRPEWAHHVEW